MSNADDLRRVMRHEKPVSRRELRAARSRAWALSPVRILMLVLSFPLLASAVATSIYIRTSPYDPGTALSHLIARGGCDAARFVGLAPAYYGEIGYHARNDVDGNGVTCEDDSQFTAAPVVQEITLNTVETAPETQPRMLGGAKFVKP